MTALALSYSTWRPAEAIQGQSTTFEGFSGYILDIKVLQGVPKKRTFRTEAASSAALAPVREAAHLQPKR